MASHRLIQWIGREYGLSVSEAVYDLLNVYYFVDGHSLNDKPKLADVVGRKLSEIVDNAPSQNEILRFLNGNEGRAEIEEALATLQELGVHGIPKFIIEGSYIVDGAAHSGVFVDIFREIEKRGYVQNGPVFGSVLGVSDEVIRKGSHRSEDLVA